MVNAVSTIFLALLAATAQVHARHDHRIHHHRRHNPHPTGTGHYHHHKHATGTGAPYGLGNSTFAGPTGTGTAVVTTETSNSLLMSTLTVLPIQESSDAAAAGSSAAASTPLIGNQQVGSQCGPATVTVTTQNTVTVTVGADSSSSSAVAAATTVITPTIEAPTSTPVATSSSDVVPVPAPTPASSSSEVVPAPAPTPSSSSSEVAAAPAPSTSSSAAPVAVKPSPYPVEGSPVDSSPAASSPAPVKQAAPSPSSAASSTTPQSTTSTSSSGGKRGIVYTDVAAANKFSNTKVTWGWNWNFDGSGLEGMEYVPSMQKPDWASTFQAACAKLPNAKFAKGINEVDNQYPMTPSAAAQSHNQYMNPIASDLGLKLGSPSVTSCNSLDANSNCPQSPSGLGWLTEFASACGSSCHVDFIDLHWYGNPSQDAATQASGFLDYVDTAIGVVDKLYGSSMPVWFSEIGAMPSTDDSVNAAFIETVLPKLDGNARVQRYSYFMADYLVQGNGLATAGVKYTDPSD